MIVSSSAPHDLLQCFCYQWPCIPQTVSVNRLHFHRQSHERRHMSLLYTYHLVREWDKSAACVSSHTPAFTPVSILHAALYFNANLNMSTRKCLSEECRNDKEDAVEKMWKRVVCIRVCARWWKTCILLLWLRSFSILGAPSFHLFFSSLTSMLPHCHWVKGFSRSMPLESCCQPSSIIAGPAFLQATAFQWKLERSLQWKK